MRCCSGKIKSFRIAPLSHGNIILEGLDEILNRNLGAKEIFVNVSFATKHDTLWAKAGWVIARDQIEISLPLTKNSLSISKDLQDVRPLKVSENSHSITKGMVISVR